VVLIALCIQSSYQCISNRKYRAHKAVFRFDNNRYLGEELGTLREGGEGWVLSISGSCAEWEAVEGRKRKEAEDCHLPAMIRPTGGQNSLRRLNMCGRTAWLAGLVATLALLPG
jgi:hypothetical protein